MIPAHYLNIDGFIPLPDETVVFNIPKEEFYKFKTANVQPWSNEDREDVLCLLLTNQKNTESIDILSTGIIAVLTKPIVFDGTKNQYVITLTSVEIVQIHVTNEDIEKPTVDWYPQWNATIDAGFIDDLNTYLETIRSNTFDISKEELKAIEDADDAFTLVNTLAKIFLKSSEERVRFFKTDNITQALTCIVLSSSKRLRKRKPKTEIPKTTSSKSEPSMADKLMALPLDADHKANLVKEVKRMSELGEGTTEYHSIYTYMQWILSLPWEKFTHKTPDLKNFIEILNQTHFGLQDVKEHLLEHIAVETLRNKPIGTVMCFVGPPGTGKTSIAKQIAVATNRNFQRISLAGVTDETLLRGFRRTYAASRPGKIVTAIRNANSLDPLLLLDEVDKMGAKWTDPSSVLLEVLDPEQNAAFEDHYIEVPIDLSKVMFICTANEEKNIPGPLVDRFELIHFRDYNLEERSHILQEYLIPKSLEKFNMQNHNLQFCKEAIASLTAITQVRQMEKQLEKALRRAAVEILTKDTPDLNIKPINSTKPNKKIIGFNQ